MYCNDTKMKNVLKNYPKLTLTLVQEFGKDIGQEVGQSLLNLISEPKVVNPEASFNKL